MPGFPVHHQLLDLIQTHVHRVSEASNHLNFCHSLLLPPSIFPSIWVFSSESARLIRWPKDWSFSISPSNEYSGLTSLGLTGVISLLTKGLSRVFSNTTIQKHQFFVLGFFYGPTLTSIHDYYYLIPAAEILLFCIHMFLY